MNRIKNTLKALALSFVLAVVVTACGNNNGNCPAGSTLSGGQCVSTNVANSVNGNVYGNGLYNNGTGYYNGVNNGGYGGGGYGGYGYNCPFGRYNYYTGGCY